MSFKFLLFIFSLFVFSSNVISQNTPKLGELDNAVVLVKIYDDNGNKIGHGSGFCIDSKGIIVTNYHVVESAYSIEVYFEGGEQYLVKNIISGSEKMDLVKLQLEIPDATTLPYLKVAEEIPKKGDKCWSIGTPAEEAYFNTIASGDVSNLYLNVSPRLIQTNAKIAHGSSGGALVNSKGEVIGVTTWGDISEDGARADINFAVWIGELKELSPINKKTLVVVKETPYCDISFFTRDKFNNQVSIYVDEKYIGDLNKYFFAETEVTCFMTGTISIRLPAGTHTYAVHWGQNDTWAKGQVTLSEGACKLYEIMAPEQNTQTNQSQTVEWGIRNRDKAKTDYSKLVDRNWIIGAGIPLNIKLTFGTYLFKHKWALRAGTSIYSASSSTPKLSLYFDMIKIWRNDKIFRPYITLSTRYRYWKYTSDVVKNSYLGPGVGIEVNMGLKVLLFTDIGYLFSLNNSGARLNGNLGLGLRF